jgi:protein gp37
VLFRSLFDPTIIDGHPDWYRAVWDAMAAAPQHTYQILTKQPRIAHSFFLETIPVWLGTSIDGTRDVHGSLAYTAAFSARLRFLSFEPLLAPIAERIPKKIGWVIIGAQTGPGATPPKAEWVQDLIDKARRIDAAVFLKDNLHWPETVKEFPKEV